MGSSSPPTPAYIFLAVISACCIYWCLLQHDQKARELLECISSLQWTFFLPLCIAWACSFAVHVAPDYTLLQKWQQLLAARVFLPVRHQCAGRIQPGPRVFNRANCMWFKPRWSSVPSLVSDLCTTSGCRESLGCVWRSVVWVHVSSRKQFSTLAYLVSLPTLSSSPLCVLVSPKAKPKQNSAKVHLVSSLNGKQLNFIWFSPRAINHFSLACCTAWFYGGLGNLLVGQAGISSSSSYCSHKKKKKDGFSPDCTVQPLCGGRCISSTHSLGCVGVQVSKMKFSPVLLLENSLVP